jgi:SAM-dependent methyltransferase
VAPNPHLVHEVSGLATGTALDAGCGEGGSALWLAEYGWRVTGVDVSVTALERVRQHAERLGAEVAARIDLVQADLTTWEPPQARFDLVTAHYVHPAGSRRTLVRRLAAAVTPGGMLLVVDHGPGDAHAHAHTHTSVSTLADALDGRDWTVEVAEARSRSDGRPHGQEVMMRDVVLVARRRRESPAGTAAQP